MNSEDVRSVSFLGELDLAQRRGNNLRLRLESLDVGLLPAVVANDASEPAWCEKWATQTAPYKSTDLL